MNNFKKKGFLIRIDMREFRACHLEKEFGSTIKERELMMVWRHGRVNLIIGG